MPLTVFPPTSHDPCELHASHRPAPIVNEIHHVVPQAWQLAWKPDAAARDKDGLWHHETIVLCPTGHRVVHTLIDGLMHRSNEAMPINPEPGMGRYSEFPTARLALQEWQDAGGDLALLVTNRLWGQS